MKALGVLLFITGVVAYALMWLLPWGIALVLATALYIGLMECSESCATRHDPETPEAAEYRRIREVAARRAATETRWRCPEL